MHIYIVATTIKIIVKYKTTVFLLNNYMDPSVSCVKFEHDQCLSSGKLYYDGNIKYVNLNNSSIYPNKHY